MAEALAGAGAAVVGIARRTGALDELVAGIEHAGGRAERVVADLSRRERIADCARIAAAAFGPPDILINAAGINLREPVDAVSFATWDRTLDLHLTMPFFLARELVPAMRERGWGRIINLASLQSQRAFADSIPYGTAKGGVVQLTRAMAEAWSRHGITVNAIAPGFFPTELTAPVFGDPEQAARNAARTMIGRNGELADIIGPAVFFASPASDYITGQTLFVDGGFSAK
jgi:NAD(P)-dependent dehydrogenase (short-subunit alcohol dehydrogenase family)